MSMGKGYLAYVILGLAAVVVISIVAATGSDDPSGKDAIPFIIGSIAVFIVGLLALQWRGIYKARAPEGPDPNAARAGKGTDDAGQVGSYNELMALMATEKYDEAKIGKARQGSFGLMKGYMGFTTVLVLICLVLGGLGVTGNLPNVGEWKYFRYVPFALAPFALAFVYFMMSRFAGTAVDQLAPLGLGMTEMPKPGIRPVPWGSGAQSAVRGATVMAGRRHGHMVEIRMDGRRHTTTVAVNAPEFEVAADGDRLVAKQGAPASVAKAIEGLAPSSHWKKLKSVKGGPEGIVAERKVDSGQGWLWDLWLCEQLAAKT
jgi:hypothetical protein